MSDEKQISSTIIAPTEKQLDKHTTVIDDTLQYPFRFTVSFKKGIYEASLSGGVITIEDNFITGGLEKTITLASKAEAISLIRTTVPTTAKDFRRDTRFKRDKRGFRKKYASRQAVNLGTSFR